MKTFARFVVLATTLLASTAAFSTSLPIKQGKHAVEINIANSGNGIDSAFPSNVKKIIGNAIATGVVDKFIVYGYGLDSDFTGCVEERAGNALPGKALDAFAKKLSVLQPQSNATFYAVSRVNVCAAPPKFGVTPQTVAIAKSDGSIACGTQGISVAQMRKELGQIRVFSAMKKSDGKIRPAFCGIATGRFNVYVIDKSGLPKATENGFNLWSSIAPALLEFSQTASN